MAPTSRPPVHSTSYSSCYSVTRPAPPASLLRSLLAAYSASDDSLHPGDIARETPGLAVDVGCGSGQLTIELAAVCREVVGLDPSSLQLQVSPNTATRLLPPSAPRRPGGRPTSSTGKGAARACREWRTAPWTW